ncbi:hypothetical protein AVEN_232816-1 [Araneus ventricosus]|uniref:Uncharacterized protein n=1 Tax=Araneus ventricosus TaxID=182803 RepID=A0A4Y2GQN2_ARAVE|nr:hypothetical protein AVEN_232816-1 [Araneus ventricosus]
MESTLVIVGRLRRDCNWKGLSFLYLDFKQQNPPLIIHPANFYLEDRVLIVSDPNPQAEAIYTDSSHLEDICACGEKGDPLHYATSYAHMSSFHFTKPSAEHTLLWWKILFLNRLSGIKIAKLISFLSDDEDLIKQQMDSTSSSDTNPDLRNCVTHRSSALNNKINIADASSHRTAAS